MLCVNRACQVTQKDFAKQHVRDLNKLVRRVKNTADMVLMYKELDSTNTHMLAYSEASFASNLDNRSQIWYITLLADDHNYCHVLS